MIEAPARDRVMAFYRSFIAQTGIPPTVREVTAGCGFASTNSTVAHVAQLIREGQLVDQLGPSHSRGITLPAVAEAARKAARDLMRREEVLARLTQMTPEQVRAINDDPERIAIEAGTSTELP